MFGFGSSSSASTSASTSSVSAPGAAPSREERKACWDSRDKYFRCLHASNVPVAGEEKGVCAVEKEGYEKDCGRSWIDYFNKRRTLELRQKATLEAAAKARDANVANRGR